MLYILIPVILNFVLLLVLTICIMKSFHKAHNNYSRRHTVSSDMICPVCQSSRVKARLPIADAAWGSRIGPKYLLRKRKFGINVVHCAPMFSDICMDCGSVIRTYIDVPDEADWIHGTSAFSKD